MADQQYCLRWNNHQPNFISVFKSLLDLEELVDVTLSVEGKHIKAHKIILSACSPYFKLLFTVTPCKHPIVILNDIKYTDLRTIVDFMYCGEINISDEQLADILEVAEILQVRGLFEPNKKTDNLSSEKEPPTKKRKRKSEIIGLNNDSQSDLMEQNRIEGVSSAERRFHGEFGPAEWFKGNGQSFNSEYDPNISLQECNNIPNTSIQETNNSMYVFDQSVPNMSQYITRPVSGPNPARRRNSKVQESENFLLALEAVRSGSLGFCKAAKLYGLNNRTLWLEYKKRGYPATRPPVGLRHKSNVLSANPS